METTHWVNLRKAILAGVMDECARRGLLGEIDDWIDSNTENKAFSQCIIADPMYAAYCYLENHGRSAPESEKMRQKQRVKSVKRKTMAPLQLPNVREPAADPWAFAYLLTGEKKIGKTSFAIANAKNALVLQFDKPQLAYRIKELMIESWKHFVSVLEALEHAKANDDFTFDRIVIDGVSEWYAMCQARACAYFGVEHPSDVEYGKCWHKIRDDFTVCVNRLLRLQANAHTGIIFIAHSEWRTKKTRAGGVIDRIVPNIPGKCEEILNGKVDGWIMYDYCNKDRILILQGDESTGAGHRIDGRFLTKDGDYVRDVHAGKSANEAMTNFINAFDNQQTYPSWVEHAKARVRLAKSRTNKKPKSQTTAA